MKTVFFGTSEFAVPVLRATHTASELLAVVTQPDRPSGRGQKLQPTPVKAAAQALDVAVYEPQRLRPFADELKALGADAFVLASYGKLLPQSVLDLAPGGAFNVHPSMLPRYRGATPIQSAIANGDTSTGVTIMLMDAGMDTGDIVEQRRVEIGADETYGALHDRLALIGAEMLGDVLRRAASGNVPRVPQTGEATVTTPISKEDLLLDLRWPPQRIVDRVRAFSPQPAARAEWLGETVKILRAHVENGELVVDDVVAPNRGRMSGEQYAQSRRAREAAR